MFNAGLRFACTHRLVKGITCAHSAKHLYITLAKQADSWFIQPIFTGRIESKHLHLTHRFLCQRFKLTYLIQLITKKIQPVG